MTRWPDFFIVGAPRAGTTSLYYHLRGHPDIFMPDVKEPHYFDGNDLKTRGGERKLRYQPVKVISKQVDYLRLFDGANANQVIGEASVFYLSDESAPLGIKEKARDARIIMLLREPIDRAYSAYLLAVREGMEKAGSFNAALREDHDYFMESSRGDSIYIWPGLYYEQVKRYLDIFGETQVYICLYEELAADTNELVKQVCGFLGVDFDNGRFFNPATKYNSYVEPRMALLKWLRQSRRIRSLAEALLPRGVRPLVDYRLINRERPKPPLDCAAAAFLNDIYRDDVIKLKGIIGKNIDHWLPHASPGPSDGEG